jgi:hypothetical protein
LRRHECRGFSAATLRQRPAPVAQVRTLSAASEIQRPRVLGGGVEVDRRVVPAQVTAERYHQKIALALAERVADLQKVAAHSESTAALHALTAAAFPPWLSDWPR